MFHFFPAAPQKKVPFGVIPLPFRPHSVQYTSRSSSHRWLRMQ